MLGDESLVIREYDARKDQEKVLELWQSAFDNPMASSLWQWKYIDNPYETTILICENSNGLPVVFYGGIPFSANDRGKKVLMIHLSDIMSHPDYRGSGIFIHTANAYFDIFGARDDLPIMYGFPGKYHFDIGVKYLCYSHLGKGAAFLTGKVTSIHRQSSPSHGSVMHMDKPDSCFDTLWDQLARFYPLCVVRNRAFLEWRYFHHPQKNYEVWCHKDSSTDGYSGYMVLQLDGKKAVIVDMLLPDNKDLVTAFLVGIAGMLGKRGVKTMETWLPADHFLVPFFKIGGLQQKKEPIGIIPTIRLFDPAMEMASACASFYFTMGDGDLF